MLGGSSWRITSTRVQSVASYIVQHDHRQIGSPYLSANLLDSFRRQDCISGLEVVHHDWRLIWVLRIPKRDVCSYAALKPILEHVSTQLEGLFYTVFSNAW